MASDSKKYNELTQDLFCVCAHATVHLHLLTFSPLLHSFKDFMANPEAGIQIGSSSRSRGRGFRRQGWRGLKRRGKPKVSWCFAAQHLGGGEEPKEGRDSQEKGEGAPLVI